MNFDRTCKARAVLPNRRDSPKSSNDSLGFGKSGCDLVSFLKAVKNYIAFGNYVTLNFMS
jgi:hypothetical protein